MIAWLLAPIDPARAHDIGLLVAWHGRLMVLAWGVLIPAGILAARFFKITPRQNWPEQLDNRAWWIAHLALQSAGGVAVLAGLALIWQVGWLGASATTHGIMGWSALALAAVQFTGGWLRGSKGGPTAPAADGSFAGDHYDMTWRRRVFERTHKSLGYAAVLVAVAAIVHGFWLVNAPRWMWAAMGVWWGIVLAVSIRLQRRGAAVDTYQAIWGPDVALPGNRTRPIGWGVRRPAETTKRDDQG